MYSTTCMAVSVVSNRSQYGIVWKSVGFLVVSGVAKDTRPLHAQHGSSTHSTEVPSGEVTFFFFT